MDVMMMVCRVQLVIYQLFRLVFSREEDANTIILGYKQS